MRLHLSRGTKRFVRHGIAGREVILIMAVLSIGLLTSMIVLNMMSETRKLTRCRFNLHAVQQATSFYVVGHDGRFPDPRYYDAGESSADLYWLLIYSKYIDPHMVVCPGDASPNVNVYKGPIQIASLSNTSNNDDGFGTNSNFRLDLSGNGGSWSNVSYAHRALPPAYRLAPDQDWTRLSVNKFNRLVLFGDRGPKDGMPDPNSHSYRLHEDDKIWSGNFLMGDGSAKTHTMDPSMPDPFAFFNRPTSSASAADDNPFTRERPDDPLDQFIAIFDASGYPVWD